MSFYIVLVLFSITYVVVDLLSLRARRAKHALQSHSLSEALTKEDNQEATIVTSCATDFQLLTDPASE